jgi:hypothetical protein
MSIRWQRGVKVLFPPLHYSRVEKEKWKRRRRRDEERDYDEDGIGRVRE